MKENMLKEYLKDLDLEDWDLRREEISDEDIDNILEMIEEGVTKEDAIEITLSTIADTIN